MTETSNQTPTETGPVVFGHTSDLFGWLHLPNSSTNKVPAGKPAVVICNPVGFEFIRSFRSLRLLAEQLADAGYCVLRFDYRTTGDSAGGEEDDARLAAMLESTAEAVEFARQFDKSQRVALIGLRLGATLAAKVAETIAVERLVLWAPCDSGAIYVREQQIMAAAQKKRLSNIGQPAAEIDGVDAGGFLLTPEAQTELSSLVLDNAPLPGTPDVLLLNRDDIRVPPKFQDAIEPRCSRLTVQDSPGFKDMMLPPQLAAIPGAAIKSVVDWLQSNDAASETSAQTLPATSPRLNAGDGIEELALRFGPQDRLFGIVTRHASEARTDRPAVILLCGGATHRVSANRMYVSLARSLAQHGTTVMRIDLAGIGDSLPYDGAPAGKPYTDNLTEDVEAAMDALSSVSGQNRFHLFGLCSGAYAAMRTAMRSDRVDSLLLANQLVYYLSQSDLARLASGEIASAHDLDFPRSSSVAYRAAVKLLRKVSPAWGTPGEWLAPWLLGGRLRRDIDALVARDVRLAFLLSSQDDAVDALSIAVGKRLQGLTGSGRVCVRKFSGTDHTFSPTGSQHELIDWVDNYVNGHN